MIRRLRNGDPRLARLREAARTDPRARASTFVVIAGLLTAAALLFAPPATVTYDVGAVADRAVRAPRSVAFVSTSLTDAEREKAAAAVQKQYATDPGVVVSASTHLAGAVTALGRVRNDAAQTRDQKLASAQRLAEVQLTAAVAQDVVDMTPPEWDQLAAGIDSALRTLYGQGIRAEQLDAVKADALKAIPAPWTDRQKRVGAELLRQNLAQEQAALEKVQGFAKRIAHQGVAVGA